MAEPHDGMEFESQEAAYSFYKEYAKCAGFGTAKLSSRRSRASKEFIDAKFSCIRYGNKQQSDDALNPRPSPKIGCKASLHVKRRQPDSLWYVHRFVKHHNHDLLPDQAHFFRSHSARLRSKRKTVSKLFSAYQKADCLDSYARNPHERGRSLALEAGDAQWLLQLLAEMKEDNPSFFYALDLNEDHRLRNVFWADPKAMEDYSKFRDVVSLDTSCFSSKYKIPLVLFVGLNHHAQPTLLGCALIADDTVYTLVWVMQTWLLAMGDQAPGVILSEQSEAIKAAAAAALPTTRHCLSLWHLMEKVPKQLEFLSMWHDSFVGKLNKCIHRSWSEEEFEKRWWKLVERFNLRQVEWVQTLYEDRARWAPLFMRGVSLAGMSSCRPFFDRYVQRETSLRDFTDRYRAILRDRYEAEAKANFDAWHDTPELKSPSPFEKQMCAVYTHQVFKRFQAEVLGAAACHLKKEGGAGGGDSVTYSVKDLEDNQSYRVEWAESRSEIHCVCGSFELNGYLCRHAMVVLQMSGVFCIPAKYVLHRWTNSAMSRHSFSMDDNANHRTRRYNDLCTRAIILGEEGSLSEDSYNAAFAAINEALKLCGKVKNPMPATVALELPFQNTLEY